MTDTRYRYFILTGVAILQSELPNIDGYFKYIKRKYRLSPTETFHTYDLLENPASAIKLTGKTARQLITSMKEFIELTPIHVYIIHVDKERFMRKYGIAQEDLRGSVENKAKNGVLYYLAAMKMLDRFCSSLAQQDISGAIYADSRKYLDTQLLRAFNDAKEPIYRGGLHNSLSVNAKRLCAITFANKSAQVSGLEVTDFISFVAFAKTQNTLSQFHSIGLARAWRSIKEKIRGRQLINIDERLSSFLLKK